jgi:nitrilase
MPLLACANADDPSIELIRGGPAIVSPFADVLAGPVYRQEVLLCADMDLSDRIRGKYDLDVVCQYARRDVGVPV